MLVSTSRESGCQPKNWFFGRYPLRRGWTLVREVRRLYWVGSDRKYVEAKQVSGETRSDPDWHPQ